jgi:pyruvate dehydrogenase E2 component (dihydrolipoamide acetyltransferase)
MSEAMMMTALSPTMTEGMISQWIVSEGQSVKPGDALCEIETDKATMPYESPRPGVILKILKIAGQKANVGEPIAVIGKAGEDWSPVAAAATAASTASAPPPPSSMPAIAVPSIPATPVTAPAFPELGPISPVPNRPSSPASVPPSSPLARRIARERGVDIRSVSGSGPHGRVVARDVAASAAAPGLEREGPRATATASVLAAVAPRSKPVAGLRDERVPLTKMRSIIAERLGASWNAAPHFFVRAAVDMERLLQLRATVNTGREPPLGLNAFVMRIVAAALERHPVLNATWEGDAIRFLPAADIGLAVALEGGLITPVVRSCERKGVEAIDAELAELVARARSGTLAPGEYSGASFTISNLGSFGVEEFTAIINPPGSAILALGAITKEAVVRDDAVVARRTMRITLSSDHRVIDGAVAAAFMAELKAMLEEPARVLL